jgi:hypothetical protein
MSDEGEPGCTCHGIEWSFSCFEFCNRPKPEDSRGEKVMDEQDDIDEAGEHQHELEQRQQLENSGAMDPSLFTRPMCRWPRITPEDEFRMEMHRLKAISFALDKIFGGK